jgi:D-alanine-D-alanine ligase
VNEDGDIFFLEINFTCSVFYKDGYEGSADFILKYDEVGQAGFLHHIISEGVARHQRKLKPYVMKGDSISGFGIYATRNIREGEIVFTGEERSHRIVTRRFVENSWNDDQKLNFRRYAYALSEEVFALWADDPTEWAPQNHSCEANTAIDGLNVLALRNVRKGEELTLDYAVFLDDSMEPFECRCGSSSCRGSISGVNGNSVNFREQKLYVLNGQ